MGGQAEPLGQLVGKGAASPTCVISMNGFISRQERLQLFVCSEIQGATQAQTAELGLICQLNGPPS